MSFRNSITRYGSLSIWLHWLMLILLVAVYACIELREFYPRDSDFRVALKTWHYMLGMLVFVLVWLRLLAMKMGHFPRILPDPTKWQKLLAMIVHLALYALMIGMPLTGWLLLSAEGKSTPFFGLELPVLINQNMDLVSLYQKIHEAGGTIGYFLIGLHTAIVLFHHYILGDNTLRRILPSRD